MSWKENGLGKLLPAQPRCHWLVFHPSCSILVLPGCPQGGGRARLENTVHGPREDCSPHPRHHPWDGWGWRTPLSSGFRRSRAISVRLRGCCGEGAARETPPAPLACPIAQPEAPGLFFALLPCPQFPSPPSTAWSYLSDANFSFSISSQGPSWRASPPAWLPG